LGQGVLARVLSALPPPDDPRVLVGTSHADDAGVFRISAEEALIGTLDFFTPIVDDPYLYGSIAAANSLSDVYAMGGEPLFALAIAAFPEDGKILPYLDVPFQHAAPRILKLMRRPAGAEKVLERIRGWRELCPEITLRSTFIAGFPGETEAEFCQLLEFLEEARLDRVGCFAYSPVEGAAANDLPGAVPNTVKEERRARLMALQASISKSRLKAKLKRKIEVLIDAPGVGRSKADAPEIDGVVHFEGGKSGEFAEVLIDRADEHDLYGRLQ